MNVDAEASSETKIGEWQVCADKLWEFTNIVLEPGCRYRFVARGTWNDADIICGPQGYNLKDIEAWKRPFFQPVAVFRPLNTGDQWFSLLGKIGEHGTLFEIGAGIASFESDAGAEPGQGFDGRLYCTANDLPFMYWNNSGAVQLEVYELKT